ncbi:MAG: substrate-binding periplasmic protein [Telluria sp.]
MRAWRWMLLAGALCAGAARADDVVMLFGRELPPYVLEHGVIGQGLEVEVARAALAHAGHRLVPRFVRRADLARRLRAGEAQGAQRGAPDLDGPGWFYARSPTVDYRDVAISLAAAHLAIFSVDDLRGKSVLAFQGASAYLGAEYHAAVQGNPRYDETADEAGKVAALFAGRVQVYVGDLNVFNYFQGKAAGATAPVAVHHIFPRSELLTNNAVFRDTSLRDAFEAGLDALHASGEYSRLESRYLRR